MLTSVDIPVEAAVDNKILLRDYQKRFFESSKWSRDLKGETILEVGSGSGRFTEHAVSTGAMVISLDYSIAVEANYASNGHNKNLLIVHHLSMPQSKVYSQHQ